MERRRMDRVSRLICDTGLDAIARSEKYYSKAAGRTVRSAPESFVQASIFQSLVKTKAFGMITLEEGARRALGELEGAASDDGYDFEGGRIDILIWKTRMSGVHVPQYPIEIKKITQRDSLCKDAIRLKSIVTQCKKRPGLRLSRGFIFGYCVQSNKEGAAKLLAEACNATQQSCGMRCEMQEAAKLETIKRAGDEGVFGAACFCLG
jgi:hypothetical protein